MIPVPPVLGAALQLADLPARADWLKRDARDLEIQNPCQPAFLDGDWRAAAREARTVLDGHTGRVGVHAPYDGMPWASPDVRLVAAMRDRLLESLEFTAAIGGTHLVLHSPFLYFGSAQTRLRGAELADGIARRHSRQHRNAEPDRAGSPLRQPFQRHQRRDVAASVRDRLSGGAR
jgi:endonuclease IV